MTLDPLYLASAVEAALAAGRIQRSYFRHALHIQKKGVIDLVTEADLAVEHAFRALIAERFPGHVVLGEEAGEGPGAPDARFRWIIDPIDGTTNFAHGLALFCVSIALEIDGRVVIGVVYDPMAKELFTAERGGGSRLNGQPIHVSGCHALGDALLCTGFPYSVRTDAADRARLVAAFAEFLGRSRGVRRLGSAALDVCYVAAGRFDGFWEHHLHPWDIAAAALLVEEAGGVVTDCAGGAFTPFAGQIVATNGHIHRDVVSTLHEVEAREPRHRG